MSVGIKWLCLSRKTKAIHRKLWIVNSTKSLDCSNVQSDWNLVTIKLFKSPKLLFRKWNREQAKEAELFDKVDVTVWLLFDISFGDKCWYSVLVMKKKQNFERMCTQQSNSFEVHWAHKSFQVWMRINRFKPERKCMLERSYNNQFFISNFGDLVLTLAAKRICFIRIDQNITDWNDLSITLGLNYIPNGFAMNCLNSTKCRIVGSFFYFFIRLIHVRIHSSHSRQNKTKQKNRIVRVNVRANLLIIITTSIKWTSFEISSLAWIGWCVFRRLAKKCFIVVNVKRNIATTADEVNFVYTDFKRRFLRKKKLSKISSSDQKKKGTKKKKLENLQLANEYRCFEWMLLVAL